MAKAEDHGYRIVSRSLCGSSGTISILSLVMSYSIPHPRVISPKNLVSEGKIEVKLGKDEKDVKVMEPRIKCVKM